MSCLQEPFHCIDPPLIPQLPVVSPPALPAALLAAEAPVAWPLTAVLAAPVAAPPAAQPGATKLYLAPQKQAPREDCAYHSLTYTEPSRGHADFRHFGKRRRDNALNLAGVVGALSAHFGAKPSPHAAVSATAGPAGPAPKPAGPAPGLAGTGMPRHMPRPD